MCYRTDTANRESWSNVMKLICTAMPAAQVAQVNLIQQTSYVSLGIFLNNSEKCRSAYTRKAMRELASTGAGNLATRTSRAACDR